MVILQHWKIETEMRAGYIQFGNWNRLFSAGDGTAFEKIIGASIPYEITERRPGDVAVCFADPTKARKELGWEAKFSLEEMCRDSWNWQKSNPNGYEE